MAIATANDVYTELGISSPTATESAVVAAALLRAEGAVKRYLRYDPERKKRVEYYPQQNFEYQGRETVWEVSGNQAVIRRVAEASTSELQVQHIPIRTIHALYLDYDGRSGSRSGSFAASTLQVEGTDYWPNWDGEDESSGGDRICRDGIIRSEGRWPITPGTVKIIYTAGYMNAEFRGSGYAIDATPIWDSVVSEAARRAKQVFVNSKKATGFVAGTITRERIGEYEYQIGNIQEAERQFGGLFDLTFDNRNRLSEFLNWGWPIAA